MNRGRESRALLRQRTGSSTNFMKTLRAWSFGFPLALFLTAGRIEAQLPVSGRPVPALTQLDTIMNDFMDDPSRTISAGVLGVSRGGRVIFLHAYGRLTPTTALPETALFRIASVTKPVTAAAIQQLAQGGSLGANPLQRFAFNLSGNGGVLNVTLPAGVPPGDARLANITVGQLLDHSAGWDRNPQPITNPWFRDWPIVSVRAAGIAMNEPDATPSRAQLMGWALQFSLDYTPGAASYTQPVPASSPPGTLPLVLTPGAGSTYSNFGYLVLGEILESQGGGYVNYVRARIMSAANWIPSTEWGAAATLLAQTNVREPGYVSSATGPSVYDYSAPIDNLPLPYGGYHIETMLAHGGLVASAQAMLRFGSLYSVQYQSVGAGATRANTMGQPISAANPMANALHTGSLPGTSTILQQRAYGAGTADDVVVYIAFNERDESSAGNDWASQAAGAVVGFLDVVNAAGTWPTEMCDGFWVTLGAENLTAGFGGYHSAYQGFQSALNRVTDGSYLRLRPGGQNWTGVISKRVRLDAPEGGVRLGL